MHSQYDHDVVSVMGDNRYWVQGSGTGYGVCDAEVRDHDIVVSCHVVRYGGAIVTLWPHGRSRWQRNQDYTN